MAELDGLDLPASRAVDELPAMLTDPLHLQHLSPRTPLPLLRDGRVGFLSGTRRGATKIYRGDVSS